MHTMKKLSLIPAAAACAALVAGCGNDGGGTATPANATVAATTPVPTSSVASATATMPAKSPDPAGAVDVKLTEWAIQPATQTAKAGRVTFRVTNAGKVPHEMVVIKTDKQAGDLGTGSRISEAGSIGEAGDIAAGATKTVTLKMPKGHYALVCNVAGHYMSGMHADFTVA